MVRAAGTSGTRLLRQPDISRDQLAFIYAGDLWTARRNGGTAQRLTRTAEEEELPKFSPDGKWTPLAVRNLLHLV
jgi:tricorn protease